MRFCLWVFLFVWVGGASAQMPEILYEQPVKLNTSWNLADALDCGTGKGKIIIRSDSIFLQAENCQHILNKQIPISSVKRIRRAWWMFAPHTTIIYTHEKRHSFITYRRRKIIRTIRGLINS